MARKKKAYRRFEELTKRAMAPGSAEADPARASADGEPDGGNAGPGPALTEMLPISLSPEVCRALELRATADNTTPSDIVEAALRRYLEIRGSRFS